MKSKLLKHRLLKQLRPWGLAISTSLLLGSTLVQAGQASFMSEFNVSSFEEKRGDVQHESKGVNGTVYFSRIKHTVTGPYEKQAFLNQSAHASLSLNDISTTYEDSNSYKSDGSKFKIEGLYTKRSYPLVVGLSYEREEDDDELSGTVLETSTEETIKFTIGGRASRNSSVTTSFYSITHQQEDKSSNAPSEPEKHRTSGLSVDYEGVYTYSEGYSLGHTLQVRFLQDELYTAKSETNDLEIDVREINYQFDYYPLPSIGLGFNIGRQDADKYEDSKVFGFSIRPFINKHIPIKLAYTNRDFSGSEDVSPDIKTVRLSFGFRI